MPAVSEKQRRFMAIAEHSPGKLKGKMPDMTHKQLHDFASTKEDDLPEKIGKWKRKKTEAK
jgi:hypothetical protein